jgi:hypothetical protein
MALCKTCKHWCGNGPFGDAGGLLPPQALCEKSQLSAEAEEPREKTLDKAYALESGGTWNGIWAGPEFGCIHHEPI